jgi:vancomycin resistance protein YoaR
MINQVSQVIKINSLKWSGFWLPVVFFLSTGGLLVTMIFAMLGYQVLYLNRAYPGVSVVGVKVGGMTQPEIVAVTSDRVQEYPDRPIVIQAGDETWTFTSQTLGISSDVVTTANQAYQVGRRGNFLADMLTQLTLIFTPRDIEPVFRYDIDRTNQALQQLTGRINYPPQNAQLVIHSATNVEAIPAQRGRRLHVESTRSLIEAAVLNQDSLPVTAVTQEVIPAITDEDVRMAYQQAKTLLSAPLIFGFSTGTDAGEWRLKPDTVAELINVTEKVGTDGKSRPAIELDREKLAPYFEEFVRVINQTPSDARLEINEAGELTVLQQSRDGRALDVEAAYQQIEASIANGSFSVELPVLLTPATISSDNIEDLGIKELVTESTSYFKGSSEGRIRNIALAASKFHGAVIPPGEVFSFNDYLGPVTKENGYDESLIIFGDRTTVGIGGGVCQVSTTAFRTAFLGGFEIVERWAHGYRVGWYEIDSVPGLDATIYTPDIDFKFRNDTDHYLLIQTKTDMEAGTLTFQFYGTSPGREVIVGQPEEKNLVKHGPPIYEEDPTLPQGIIKQVDWAKDGMEVTVTRVVKEGETIIHQDEIFSQYQPWRAVYRVGTAN